MCVLPERECAFKLVYSVQKSKEYTEEQFDVMCQAIKITSRNGKKYIKDIFFGVGEHEEEFNKMISDCLKTGWTIDRIMNIDLALLKVAIYEMIYKEIPYKIIINDIVELAKKYSDEVSPKFINGILAQIVKNLKLEGNNQL